VSLLNECLDVSRVPAGVTSAQICNKIARHEDDADCVSVSTYLGQQSTPLSVIFYQVSNVDSYIRQVANSSGIGSNV